MMKSPAQTSDSVTKTANLDSIMQDSNTNTMEGYPAQYTHDDTKREVRLTVEE